MRKLLCWSWILLLFVGCGGDAKYSLDKTASEAGSAEMSPVAEGGEALNVPALDDWPKNGTVAGLGEPDSPPEGRTTIQQPVIDNALAQNEVGGDDEPAIPEKAEPKRERPKENVERKIIYSGQVSVVVEEFESMETAIPDLVKEFNGYLKSANINRTEGRQRYGSWIARIPSVRFSEFLKAVSKLGIAEHQEQSTQDVTMEFLDVKARIASKKQVEQRILKLLEDRDGKLSDIVEAEHKLAEVRSEIESMEGRIRYLQNQTVFSTVTIEVREEKNYVPEKAPDFGGRIGKAWQDSLRSLKIAGQNFVIGVVAFVPWILPLGIFFGGGFFLLKRLVRRFSDTKNEAKK